MSNIDDFETKYAELEKAVKDIKNEKLKLSDALKIYDDAMVKYRDCKKILEDVKGQIHIRGEEDD